VKNDVLFLCFSEELPAREWLVDQLEQAGLVGRKRNDADRRILRLWLTATG
jgi:hypothetical protein